MGYIVAIGERTLQLQIKFYKIMVTWCLGRITLWTINVSDGNHILHTWTNKQIISKINIVLGTTALGKPWPSF